MALDVEKTLLKIAKSENDLKAEEVRALLDPKAYIDGLQALLNDADTCKPEALARLKFQSDIYLALLKKCLPDLKSLEFTKGSKLGLDHTSSDGSMSPPTKIELVCPSMSDD